MSNKSEAKYFTWTQAGCAIGGVTVGAVVLPVALAAVGLSAAGPVAGGLFAANQGAGIAAGTYMAGA